MTDGPDDVIARYAARLLALKAERDAAVSDDDLEAVARDLGMSDADVKAVDDAVAAHVARAGGHAGHGRVDDAVAELDAAAALAPRNPAVLTALGEALLRRGTAADRARAKELGRAAVAVDPQHQAGYALMNAAEGKSQKKSGARAAVAFAAAAVVVPFAVVFGVIFSQDHIPPIDKRPKKGPHAVARPADPPPPPPPSPPSSTSDDTGKVELPVTLVADDKSAGLRLETRSSLLSRYSDSAFYELRALVVSERDALVAEIDFKIELLDDDGAVVASSVETAPASHEAQLRKGDAAVVARLMPASKTASSARLTVTRAAQEPATSWPPAKEIALRFDNEKPAGVDIVVRERARSLSQPSLGLGPFFEATWEFENKGSAPISTLEVRLVGYDKDGDEIALPARFGDGGWYVTAASSHPVIRPGETRLLRVTRQVPAAFARGELEVIELR